MPISQPRLESLPVALEERTKELKASWPRSWATWFTETWQALLGWRVSYYATLSHDFGLIPAQSQSTQTVTVTGARSGDSVFVRPTTAVNGIIVDGTVTAANTVTVRAVNYSAAGIDPATQIYRITVLQQ